MQRYLTLILGAALSPVVVLAATPARAGSLNFSISPFTGSNAEVDIWLSDLDDGGVQFDFRVDESVNLADLRGIFFDINDSSLVSGLNVTANINPFSDLDDDNFYSLTSRDVYTSSAGDLIKADKAALNGLKADGFNLALEIGSQGLKGGKDDFQGTSFIVKHATQALSLENFAGQEFGVRMQSVGANRQGSTKMYTQSPTAVPTPIPTPAPTPQPKEVPEPSVVLGLMAVGAAFERTRRRQLG
ncbi:PEP-CTERM sorting domain-containing protein [Baaleninema simplex]|uniref:PEP-CTERM sorting domain-containing protein n=1 Tax=Baaleninema simplex TaxID=2862350 RepID=UPI000347DCF9|nr:PEP-CTERM sorting domain-containing protein [Baaleninema simplex]